MHRPLPAVLSLSVFMFVNVIANCQSYVGAGFGTFNIPGATVKFRGFGPSLRYEYIQENQRISAYIDVAYLTKSLDGGTADIYNSSGLPIRSVPTTNKFSYIYSQLGFKALLGAEADDRKVIPYIGGGIAVLYRTVRSSYQTTYNVSDNVDRSWLYGFHFTAGLQYNFKPVILELRGNLDIILKPLVDDNSNILTNLRLSAIIPISH